MPHTLDPNRWTRIESIFYAALEMEPAARMDFVKNQSQGDQELVDEVVSLLGSLTESTGFLDQPLSRIVKEVAAEQNLDRLSAGRQIDHFTIEAKIGAGGMGQVYRALDTRLGRKIALKALAPYLTYDEAAFRRFQQEACAASALNHPNILTVYEFGEMDGVHYIATELIEGPTLRQKLQQGRLDAKTSVVYAIQIASALAAAHAREIIHRDIKPENILIRADGLIKLVDFGIAKLGEARVEEASNDVAKDTAANQTQAGMLMGTVRYMSPEQAQQMPVDGRSDLFSLGAVLYEMLAGTPAFQGDSHEEIRQRIVSVDPPMLAEYGVEVPPELELIVEKALRKECESRYQTARDMLVDLEQFKRKLEFEANLIRAGYSPSGQLRARPVGESPSGSGSSSGLHLVLPVLPPPKMPILRRGRVLLLSATAILIFALVAVFYFVRNRPAQPTIEAPRTIAILPFRNLNQDTASDFLEVSLADALIAKLADIKALTVRPAAVIKGYRNSTADPRSIASELHVDLLLTGTYRKEANTLHIGTRLLNAKTSAILWQHAVSLPYDQLPTVQDRLAREIIDGLALKLTPTETQRITLDPPENCVAYEYYLRGVDLYSLNDFSEAIDVLKKSISLDPEYAPAWAQLGRAYTTHASLQFGGHEQYIHAREAYTKALSLDPGLVNVRVYMANLLTDTGRVEEAVPLLREALDTNPGFAEAHWEMGYAYRFAGMLDESVAESEESRRLDPEVKINSSAINGYLYRGEYRKFLQSLPAGNSGYTLFYRGLAEYYLNDFEDAQIHFDRAYAVERTILPAPIGAALSDGLKHRPQDGLKLLRETETRFDQQGVSDPEMLYKLAQAYAVLGDAKSALRVLQQSADGGFFCASYLAADPLMNSLRGLPRFKELQGQIQARHEQFRQRFAVEQAQGN